MMKIVQVKFKLRNRLFFSVLSILLLMFSSCTFNSPFGVYGFSTVYFDKNGGDSEPFPASLKVVNNGSILRLPEKEPERKGYYFRGWYRSNDGGKTSAGKFDEGSTVKSDMTVYADWDMILPCKIIFDKNQGDTEAVPNELIVPSEGAITDFPSPPVRKGYKFSGWRLANGIILTSETIINAGIRVFAIWESEEYTVTFISNNADINASPSEITVGYGEKLRVLPAPPERAGYTFSGWYINENEKIDDSSTVYNDIEVNARWEKNVYKIKFYANILNGDLIESYGCLHGETFDKEILPPARNGYDFAGWNTESSGEGKTYNKEENIISDISYYAIWVVKSYTVTYFSSSGEFMSDSVLFGSKAVFPEVLPEKTGMIFSGWFRDADFKNLWDFNTPVEDDVDLYAYFAGEYSIGQTGPAGGVIFYINNNARLEGYRYLEAAPSDFETSHVWGSIVDIAGASGVEIGMGAVNSRLIYERYGSGDYAVYKALQYQFNDFDDWFLPSADELKSLSDVVNLESGSYYWSSSQYNAFYAYYFHNGELLNIDKGNSYKVRFIRAF